MSFPVSPGVNFREIDLSTAVAEQISSNGSFAGEFSWGPAYQIVRVGSEEQLVSRFGQPKNGQNAVDFFTAASFLAYSSALDVVRVVDRAEARNSTDSGVGVLVANNDEYEAGTVDLSSVRLLAKYAGEYGNNIGASFVNSPAQYQSTQFQGTFTFSRSSQILYTRLTNDLSATSFVSAGDIVVVQGVPYEVSEVQNNTAAPQGGFSYDTISLTKIYSGSLSVPAEDISVRWKYSGVFGATPTEDQVYVVVYDATGKITSQKGTILESFVGSKTAGAKAEDGSSLFINDVLKTSQFILPGGTSLATVNSTRPVYSVFTGGSDGVNELDEYIAGYELFKNVEEVEAPLIIAGSSGVTGKGASSSAVLANYIIQNVAEVRKDSVVFVSPGFGSVVNNKNNEVTDVLETRKKISSSSYAAIDSGWKYMYDRYNDVFRWIPLCGDHAGIYSRVDREREPWYSAAGTSRGIVKNVVKLAWTPDQNARDALYPKDINPVFNVPGTGPTFFGDKTLLGKNSVFSRIQTRRLFIILEKTISSAAKELLFEFNDEFTQNRFVSIVEPFLRDVKGRRGIEDFAVIADSSVNTPQVVQNNRFVGQIYIKPLYTIEFIRLDFVAVGASVEFSTVIGKV